MRRRPAPSPPRPDALSNGRVTVALRGGGLGADRPRRQPNCSAGGLGLHLRRDTTDTWTFHTDRWEEPVEATLADAVWQVEETGPLRVRARLDGRLRHSRMRLTVWLRRGEPAVHVDLEVNFDERYTLLQMPIELAAAPARWTDGLADGHVAREPSPAEWPFLGWSRLRVGNTDLGLVTSDFYSHSVDGPPGSRPCSGARVWPGAAATHGPTPAATNTPTRACIASPSPSTSPRP